MLGLVGGCAAVSSFDELTGGVGGSENGLDAASEGKDAEPTNDALSESDAGDPGEAGDGATTDASPESGDAGTDASVDGGGYCESEGTVTYCTDFEGAAVVGWTFPVIAGGTATVSDAASFSPTHALRFFRPIVAQDGGLYANARLERIFPVTPTTQVRSKWKFKTNAIVRDYSFFAITFGNYSARVRLQKSGMAFREDIPVDGGSTTVSTTTGLGIGSPVDTWTTAEIVLTFGAGSSSVSVWVNGVATLNAVPTSAHLYVRPVEIDLGILTFDFGAAAQEVFVDDLLVDIK